MYRFLLRPRWIALILGVALLVTVFIRLADWQFGRNQERGATNQLIERNLAEPARPVSDVAAPGTPLDPGREWTMVTARGRYDADHELLVRYRHLDGEPGFEILTPLVTGSGAALLVDRGWVAAPGGTTEPPDVPAPPKGEVSVTGRTRVSESGPDEQVQPATGQVRYIDIETIGKALPYPVFGTYVELTASRPAPDPAIELLPPPELDPGPFLSYGVQWWLFAAIAVGGLIFLAYDEAHGGVLRERLRRRERSGEDPPYDRESERAR